MMWIALILLFAAVGVPAVLGVLARIRRAGVRGGLGKPLAHLGPWFAVLPGIFAWQLAGSGWWLILGALAGLMAFIALLGLDEIFDGLFPSFYACLGREVRSFFSTPIPYFVLFLFSVLCGLFFWGNLKFSERVSVRYVFDSVSSIGFFLFPLLTMGLFARERSEGTMEVLMTAPVSEAAVTVAKFLATMTFYLVMLVPTFVYYLILKHIGQEIGKPDPGPVASAYVGMILTGGFFVSLGIFASSLSSSQILSALLSWVLIIFFLVSGGIAEVMGATGTWLGDILEYMDPLKNHLNPFLSGVIHPKNVVFFLSFTVFFLFLTVRVVETRKWR
jgi:ABC-2 type transport system permease protein